MNHDFEIYDGVLSKYHGSDQNVAIPDNVTKIGSSAFEHCRTMLSVEIPEGVTAIGRFAFYGCKRLADVKLPESLTTIEEKAFCDCSALEDIAFPDGITHVDGSAFEGCHYLEEITIFGQVFSIEELMEEYDAAEIAEDLDIDEDEICNLNEAVHDVVVSELVQLLINGEPENLYMPEDLRDELKQNR